MRTSPPEHPGPRVVRFTACGDAALDQLAASLAAQCDGSPASIADVLAKVLDADSEHLAESLSDAAGVARPGGETTSPEIPGTGPEAESPDDAARRRLASRARPAGDTQKAYGYGVDH